MIKESSAWVTLQRLFPRFWYNLEWARLRLWAWRRARSAVAPILVYQMSKVGSTTVARSLRAAGIDDVFHAHYLSDSPASNHGERGERLHERAARLAETQASPPLPHKHIFVEQALKSRIQRPDFRCKVITLVRDPIAREVSEFFQTYRFRNPDLVGADGGGIDIHKAINFLQNYLESPDNYTYTFEWFDNELKDVFDINVFAYPFDKRAGYAHIESTQPEVLVMQLENLSELLPGVVADFVGHDLDLVLGRRRTDSRDSEAYRKIKKNVKVSSRMCRKIYSTPFVQHFYSESMISEFTQRWCQ